MGAALRRAKWFRAGAGCNKGDRGQALVETALVMPLLVLLAVCLVDLSDLGTARIGAILAARAAAWSEEEVGADRLSDWFLEGRGGARIVRVRAERLGAGDPSQVREVLSRAGLSGAGGMLQGALGALYDTRRAQVALEMDAPAWAGAGTWAWTADHTVDRSGAVARGAEWIQERIGVRRPPKIDTRGH